MTEPTITCPSCKTDIRLTESLAAPLIAETRKQFEQRLSQKDEEIARRNLDDAKREAEEGLKLKVMEKDQTVASMHSCNTGLMKNPG